MESDGSNMELISVGRSDAVLLKDANVNGSVVRKLNHHSGR